jgi:hypothetical protein
VILAIPQRSMSTKKECTPAESTLQEKNEKIMRSGEDQAPARRLMPKPHHRRTRPISLGTAPAQYSIKVRQNGSWSFESGVPLDTVNRVLNCRTPLRRYGFHTSLTRSNLEPKFECPLRQVIKAYGTLLHFVPFKSWQAELTNQPV